jgi:DNA-binding NarL/FixJ family response regulator
MVKNLMPGARSVGSYRYGGDRVKMARTIRVAILSDSRLFREAVSSCLATEPEVEVVGQANTIHDLLLRAQGRSIDVLLVYPGIRPLRPLEAPWDVKTLLPASRVALLGCEQDHPEIARWNEVDNVAWLDQDTSYQSVLEAIEALTEGRASAGGHQPKVGTERSWAPSEAWSRAAQDPISARDQPSVGARLPLMRSATPFPAIRGRGRA